MPRVIDISQPLGARTAVWPGDRPVEMGWTMRRDRGDSVNVAELMTSVHAGTHVDGPHHFFDGGVDVAALSLDAYVGPALVVDAVGVAALDDAVVPAIRRAWELSPAAATARAVGADAGSAAGNAAGATGAPALPDLTGLRVLFHTRARADAAVFPDPFAAFDPAFARRLAAAGARLVGTDAPSVDVFDSTTLDAHHAFAAGGVAIVENLALDGVPPGQYVLVAAPLKLAGADSAPARALLIEGVAWPWT